MIKNFIVPLLVLAWTARSFAALPVHEKVVGGHPAIKNELSFQVSLQTESGSHFCGGSLIKKNWVLTAAHCVLGSSPIKIITGLYDRDDKTGTETFSAAKIVSYPQFDATTFDFDYALIQLSGDSTFRTIELNKIEREIPENSTSDLVWTSGWGLTSEGVYDLPRILQEVQLPLVSKKYCNSTAAYNGRITDHMLCAGLVTGGKDSCQGDSGGPLFSKQASGDFTLLGVVSWGEGCARPNKFGVYSKVNPMVDWIEQQTQ